jgi:hypothetical protein
MTRNRFANILILLFLLAGFNALADTVKLDQSGTLHKIEVVHYNNSSEENPKTYLVHTLQKEDGTTERKTIPLTEDPAPDLEPQIDLRADTQQIFLTWSRFDGTDYEICLSKFFGTHWSAPVPVTMNSNDDRDSRIVINSSGLIHLMWKEKNSGVAYYYYLAVDSMQGLSAGIPDEPDILIPPDSNLVLPDGTTPPSSSLPEDQDFFFAFHLPIHPNRIVLWGGRDDPSPINFREAFKLLDADQELSSLKAQIVNGKLTLIFRSDDILYYTYRTTQGWTPYRVIKLNDTLSEGKAELLIKDMLGGL